MTISPCNRLPTRFAALTCILAGAIGLGPAAADAAPKQAATPQLIERDARAGKIERDTATLYVAYALGRPGKLPARYRSDTPWDGTLPLLRVREAVKRMQPSPRREAAREVLAAPPGGTSTCDTSAGTLPNATQTTNFYVQSGTVADGLTLDDYLTSLEGAWAKEVDSFGWARPPLAAAPAPGNKYHVRIDALAPGLYGYVSPAGTHAGLVQDNPATLWNEGDAYASCMVLNRDYSGFPSTRQASLDSTTAHEFNHSIQFGYGALSGANVPDDDFVEGGATWMEDEVYDSANDNYNYLWPDFADSMGDYDASPYPYWIAFRGLTERYVTGVAGGGEQVMQDFWEATSKNTGNNLTAMQAALAVRGTTLADAFHAYAIAVKFNRPCGAGYVYPYCFEEGPAYVTAASPTAVHETIAAVGDSTPNARVEDNYALNWVSLPATGGAYDVTLSNTSAGGQLRGSVVCDTGSALSLSPLPAVVGPGATSTLPGFTPASCSGAPVLVVTNQSQTSPNPTTSTLRTYRASTASSTTPPTSHTLTVSKGGTGSGTVTSSPGGIDCGADCSQSYPAGTTVTLTATAAPGAAFSGWSGDCSGSGTTCTVSMTAARSVTATFDPSSTPTNHTLTVSKVGTGSGTVTSNPAGINCGADCSESYPAGTAVTLTATVAPGAAFSGWSGDCSGSGTTCTVSMTAARSVTATFAATTSGTGTTTTTTTTAPPSVLITSPVGAAALIDRTPPVQSPLRLSASSFRAARSGPSVRAAATVGTKVVYVLSEPSTSRFRVERALRGRRVDGRCVRTTRLNAARRPCTRYVLLRGTLLRTARAGVNSFRFTGRLSGRALSLGRYRLVARSTDAAGNRSGLRRVGFRIVR